MIYKMDLNRLNETVINIPVDLKYDNLIEYYRVICFKLILTCESHIYKTFQNRNLQENLDNQEINFTISKYLKDLLQYIEIQEDTDINNYINNIEKIIGDAKEFILQKITYIINHFYTFLIRDKLNVKSYESYINNFQALFPEYFSENKVEILKIIIDKNFVPEIV